MFGAGFETWSYFRPLPLITTTLLNRKTYTHRRVPVAIQLVDAL